MGIAVPIVASIVAGAVVSKAATSILKSVGVSDSTANLLGGIAGIVGGSYAYDGVSAAMNTSNAASAASAAADAASTQTLAGVPDVAKVGLDAVATPLDMSGISAPQALPNANMGLAAKTAGESIGGVAGETMGKTLSTIPGAIPPPNLPWYEKMWNSDKTGEIVAGVGGGMAQGAMLAGSAKDERDAKLDRQREIDDSWTNANVNLFPTIQYPQVARSGMLSRNTRGQN